MSIGPRGGTSQTLLIFYGGGQVGPKAYEWLGRVLAVRRVQPVIPVFPLDLAVTDAGRAGALIARSGAGERVVLAGHTGQVAGLILMAAHPARNVDLREAPFPVVSLLAEGDGVATGRDVHRGLSRLPP